MLGTFGRWGVAAVVCLTAGNEVLAQGSWADALVDVKRIDYGVVATGAETQRTLTIRNTTAAQVHISSVSTACKCAEAGQPTKTLLQPGEEATIEVRLNTRQFSKKRDTSLTIFFDSPQYAALTIPITAYIRTDVVFDPGIVRFGTVDFGTGSEVTVKVAYAGRPDWKIVDIKIGSKDLEATLRGPRVNGTLVDYDVVMKLSPAARPQRLRDLVTLVTDDAANPYVPLMVEGVIVPDISVSPEVVSLQKPISAGDSTKIQVVIKGKKPFVIEDIDCAGMQGSFKAQLEDQAKSVHVVRIEFSAPERSGKFTEELLVKIADRTDPVSFRLTGTINSRTP
jgi:hypothetical protein